MHSTNFILLSEKLKQLSCKANAQEDGGCNYPINNISPAHTTIISRRAATKYPSAGSAHRKEAHNLMKCIFNIILLLVYSLPGFAQPKNSANYFNDFIKDTLFRSAHLGVSI